MVCRMKRVFLLLSLLSLGTLLAKDISLVNVSYDPTRELYADYNEAFATYWKEKTGDTVKVNQLHGGSGNQARAIVYGLEADVATLALEADINTLHEQGDLVPADWQKRLPNNSTPYTSTIVFLVRKGNPKGIKDWDDLVKPGVEVITPNPKSSGGGQWNFLAAWAYALKHSNKDPGKAKEFVTKLYKNVPVLDPGARGATLTFTQRKLGDVLLAWENEAYLSVKEAPGEFEIVAPSLSIVAEPPVTVVDKVVDKRGTREVATEYLNYLYSDVGQELAAKHFYRPTKPEIAAKYADKFPKLDLVTIDKEFGGWKSVSQKYFGDRGIFDAIYEINQASR
jgi:sulfate/thiosulfate transport system substrate-binding protein